MFGTWDELRTSLDHYVATASNSEEIMHGFLGDRSSTAVNHLITRIDDHAQLVSKRVTIDLVAKHDRTFLLHLRTQQFCSNASFAGWIFEGEVLMWV